MSTHTEVSDDGKRWIPASQVRGIQISDGTTQLDSQPEQNNVSWTRTTAVVSVVSALLTPGIIWLIVASFRAPNVQTVEPDTNSNLGATSPELISKPVQRNQQDQTAHEVKGDKKTQPPTRPTAIAKAWLADRLVPRRPVVVFRARVQKLISSSIIKGSRNQSAPLEQILIRLNRRFPLNAIESATVFLGQQGRFLVVVHLAAGEASWDSLFLGQSVVTTIGGRSLHEIDGVFGQSLFVIRPTGQTIIVASSIRDVRSLFVSHTKNRPQRLVQQSDIELTIPDLPRLLKAPAFAKARASVTKALGRVDSISFTANLGDADFSTSLRLEATSDALAKELHREFDAALSQLRATIPTALKKKTLEALLVRGLVEAQLSLAGRTVALSFSCSKKELKSLVANWFAGKAVALSTRLDQVLDKLQFPEPGFGHTTRAVGRTVVGYKLKRADGLEIRLKREADKFLCSSPTLLQRTMSRRKS